MADIVTDYGVNYNWKAYKNGQNTFTITFTSGGSAFDLSDYTFTLNIKTHGSSTNKLQLTQGSGITNGTTTGILTIALSQTQASTTLPRDSYFYELTFVKDSLTYRVIQGTLTLSSETNPSSASASLSPSITLAGTAVTAAVTIPSVTSAIITTALGYTPYNATANASKFIRGNSGTVLRTSDFGAVSDADLSLGSTSFGTDNTSILQGILDLATASAPITIIWDGQYSCTGLRIKGYTTIIALPGCGAILRDHSSAYLFKNYNKIAHSVTDYDEIIDKDIAIIGGIWNQNGYNTGPTGSDLIDATYGHPTNGSAQYAEDAEGDFMAQFGWFGVENVVMRDCKILASRKFAILMHLVNRFHFENIEFDWGAVSSRDPYYYDGIHINGPAKFGKIQDVLFRKGKDDAIAFCADGSNTDYTFEAVTDMDVSNVVFDDTAYGFRFYSGIHRIDRITISNVKGDTKNYGFTFTNDSIQPAGAGPGNIGTVNISNVHYSVTSSPNLTEATYASYMYVDAKIDVLNINNWTRTDFSKNYATIKLVGDADIGQLNINGLNHYTESTTFAKDIIDVTAGTIDKLNVSNAVFEGEGTQLGCSLIKVTGGTVTEIKLTGVTQQWITYMVNHTGGTLTDVIATGVIHKNSTGELIRTTGTVTNLYVSGYKGESEPYNGTFTNKIGEAFDGKFQSYTPVYTGFSSDPSGTVGRYTKTRKLVTCIVGNTGNGTSNATTLTVTLPVQAASQTTQVFMCRITDNGTPGYGMILIPSGSLVAEVYTSAAAGAFTASGNKRVQFAITYESA